MVQPLPFLEFLGRYAEPVTQVIYFVVAFVFVYIGGRMLFRPVLDRALSGLDLDTHEKRPIKRVVTISLLFVALLFGLTVAGLDRLLRSLSTIAAAGTLAIGFAMQNMISNIVAGVFIYTDKPFRIGDWIEWDEEEGIVEDISLRVTRVRTFDNELLTVPNSLLTEDVIKNPVANDKLRIKFDFGIGYEDDIETAMKIIVEEANRQDGVLETPAPSVHLTELADSYVGLTARVWIDDPTHTDFVEIRSEFVTNVKNAFDEHDIDIPYPQIDLSGGVEFADPSSPVTETRR